jgi:16S rRNA G966 N2-methylase RsmD
MGIKVSTTLTMTSDFPFSTSFENIDSMNNTLYYSDNLDVIRRYLKDDSMDLIYLDPPLNWNATYNVLFAEQLEEKKIDIPPVGHSNVIFKKVERHIKTGK